MNDFDEYIRQGEPDKVEKSQIWQTAIGLQQVDGLTPSAYLIETAKENIEGKITIDEVKSRIDSYYQTQTVRNNDDDRTEEADKVSARIAEILGEKTFTFSPVEYINIHKRLFTGIYEFAGIIRDYNFTKNEWVLNGKPVFYASSDYIRATLDYDFGHEKNFIYKGLDKREIVAHIVKFISGLWQIHAFGEGNTRTTAVFTIKYLRTFGFKVNNALFAENSCYFHNALVRANYNDYENKNYATTEYLMHFFGNLLFEENNELKNKYLHIFFKSTDVQSTNKLGINDKNDPVKVQNGGLNGGLNSSSNGGLNSGLNKTHKEIIILIKENPQIRVFEMAQKLLKPIRTIENNMKQLKEKGIIARIGSKKTGEWEIKEQ